MSQQTIQGYRLSPQQKDLWLRQQSDPAAPYWSLCLIGIGGVLNDDLLKRALDHVVRRQEILRTTFRLLPGMTVPVQVIAEHGEIALVRHDLSNHASDDRAARVSRLYSEVARREVDYARLPLLQADLIKQSNEMHSLILSVPALCADGPSLQILAHEVAEVYAAFRRAEAEPAFQEAMQYADYAEWRNELLESAEGAKGRQFWSQFDLRQDRLSLEKPGSIDGFRPAAIRLNVLPETASALRQVATNCSASTAEVLLAAWCVLLSRSKGADELVVGVASEGRKFAELEKSIGLILTFLPISCRLSDDLRFSDLVRQLHSQRGENELWQEYFSPAAVNEVNDQTPRFPFCFEWRPRPADFVEGGLTFSFQRQDSDCEAFALKLVAEETAASLAIELQYNERSFAESNDLVYLARRLETLIASVTASPDERLGELNLVGEEEATRLRAFNFTAQDFPRGQAIHRMFERAVALEPNRIALVFEDDRLTYTELNQRANRLANHLRRHGVGPDVVVGLCLERSVNLIVGLLGIMKAGGAYLPLDPGLPQNRIAMMLEDAGARVLVTRSEFTGLARDQVDQVVDCDADQELLANESTANLPVDVSDQNLVYVIFTSGSTGRPKGVAVEHRQLANYIHAISEQLQLPPSGSFATVSTIAADLGNTMVFPSLCKGGTLHLISEERATNPDELAGYFRSNSIDCLKIVPSHLAALLSSADPSAVLPKRKLVLGGEACSWKLIDRIKTLAPQCEILNHYGPTEATVGATTCRLNEGAELRSSDLVSLGRPLGNMQVFILDRRMRLAPIGAPGELHLAGQGLARGYINRAAATAEKFIPNPFGETGSRLYKTGDLARYGFDGRIEFLGRVDDQIKIRGYRIEPREIEIVLRQHGEIEASVVMAREDQRLRSTESALAGHPRSQTVEPAEKRLVAYCVTRNGKAVTSAALREFLAGRLPDYMIPSVFLFLERLPLTANGKIDRRALPAPDHSGSQARDSFALPRNQVEEALTKIWAGVLGLDRVGINDNFFELGGDSILSIQIIARANQAGLRLTPRQLFQHQTIAELATVAGTETKVEAEQGVVTGSVPLTPMQTRFLEQNQPEPHHYNQAMLLEIDAGSRAALEVNGRAAAAPASLLPRVLEQLLIHHDALRLRFLRNETGWRQSMALPDSPVQLETIDLGNLALTEQAPAMQRHGARLQASLDLEHGPLMRAALFDRGAGGRQSLLIVIHHLAVDGVSWGILLEDLQTLYSQIGNGQSVKLAAKTTSFKQWAERLKAYAKSEELLAEASYWRSLRCDGAGRLPIDFAPGPNTAASARTVSVALDGRATRALLQEVPAAYRTQINEVLLTALARVLKEWTSAQSLLLDLEGHGREELFEQTDLSRTVGWFTTIFPVVLDVGEARTAIEALRSVKDQLRAIPHRGIGYGLLRYASGNSEIAAALAGQAQAEVRFNYLGQIDRALPESAFLRVAGDAERALAGPVQSARNARGYLLNIIGSVKNGELRLEFAYSENCHRRETIERLAHRYLEELRELIALSAGSATESLTPSDFPSAKLNQEELSKVLARLGKSRA